MRRTEAHALTTLLSGDLNARVNPLTCCALCRAGDNISQPFQVVTSSGPTPPRIVPDQAGACMWGGRGRPREGVQDYCYF